MTWGLYTFRRVFNREIGVRICVDLRLGRRARLHPVSYEICFEAKE
jgi:hypothetical protein